MAFPHSALAVAIASLLAACAGRAVSEGASPESEFASVIARFDSVPLPPLRLPPGRSTLDSIRATNLGRRTWAIQAAPPCHLPRMMDTTGWVPAVARDMAYPITIPPGYVHDTAWTGIHGGVRWEGPSGYLTLTNSWWGPSSDEEYLRACRVTTPAGDYIAGQWFGDSNRAIFAFPADTVWRPSIAVTGGGRDTLGLAIAWTVLRTVRAEAPIPYRTAPVIITRPDN